MTTRREWMLALLASLQGAGCDARRKIAERACGCAIREPALPIPGNGKIEVIDFFRYSCPHCNAFEPLLAAWTRKLPPHVVLHRQPVGTGPANQAHIRLFHTLEALGRADALHTRVFDAIHVNHRRLEEESDMAAFAQDNGIDGARFLEVFHSPAVEDRVRQSAQVADRWKVNSVPSLGIQGRYYISIGTAGSPERVLLAANELIQRESPGLKAAGSSPGPDALPPASPREDLASRQGS